MPIIFEKPKIEKVFCFAKNDSKNRQSIYFL